MRLESIVCAAKVDVHFTVNWNDVAQGLSSAAVYEFQAWARAVTYIKTAGSYIVDCQGMVIILTKCLFPKILR